MGRGAGRDAHRTYGTHQVEEIAMSTYRIVVGVDGSDGGTRALRWAAQEVASRGGTVQAVAAWTYDSVPGAVVAATNPIEERERARRGLDDSVAEVAAVFPKVAIASEVIEGN